VRIRTRLKRFPGAYKAYKFARYLTFQVRVAWFAWHDRSLDDSPVPVPPPRLRFRVHGALDAGSFMRTGATVAADVRRLTANAARDFDAFDRVLDFGCGCGRVLAHLTAGRAVSNGRFFATDIDKQAIAWCRSAMPGIDWRSNDAMPPLPYDDAMFDFVFSISVFTHLDEKMQQAWLVELHRVLRPGCLLLLTVHGEYVHSTLEESEQEILRRDGVLFVQGITGRLKLDGLPDFYQAAYHTKEYIAREWSTLFELVEHVPRGINAHQDAVLLRKRATA